MGNREKVVVMYDKGENSLYSLDNVYLAPLQGEVGEYKESKATSTTELIKLGVSVDEVLKLKHNGLI